MGIIFVWSFGKSGYFVIKNLVTLGGNGCLVSEISGETLLVTEYCFVWGDFDIDFGYDFRRSH